MTFHGEMHDEYCPSIKNINEDSALIMFERQEYTTEHRIEDPVPEFTPPRYRVRTGRIRFEWVLSPFPCTPFVLEPTPFLHHAILTLL